MTKTSCIAHPADQMVLIIREDYLAICDKNHCAAAILNVFEYWTNIKLGQRSQAKAENEIARAGGADEVDESLWIYKSVADLQVELMGLFGETKISSSLKTIEAKGFLDTRNNPKYGWDRTIQYLFKTEAIQSVISRNGSLKNKKSKPRNKGLSNRKNKVAIPKTTTKTTNKDNPATRPIFDAIAKFVFELTDLKGISGARIGKLETVAKRVATTRVPSASQDDIAQHIERFARAESFKPGIQGESGFELKFAVFLQKLPPMVVPETELVILPKPNDSDEGLITPEQVEEGKRLMAQLLEKTNANTKPHDPYGGWKPNKEAV